jgi:hypothetical protein
LSRIAFVEIFGIFVFAEERFEGVTRRYALQFLRPLCFLVQVDLSSPFGLCFKS